MDKVCVTQVKALIKTIVKFRAEKILRRFFSGTKLPFEGQSIKHEDDSVSIL